MCLKVLKKMFAAKLFFLKQLSSTLIDNGVYFSTIVAVEVNSFAAGYTSDFKELDR
jgi:hypothetical protein